MSSARVAEASKLLENIYRAVNIALVNELKMTFDRMGIDVWEVIEAAKTKPFGFQAFYPGPGLGGHCIPLDPFYLSWKAAEHGVWTRFIELAGEINTGMPAWVVSRVSAALSDEGKSVKGAKVLILGLSYKPDIDDDRESPSYELIRLLRERGAEVSYCDPHFPATRPTRKHELRMRSVPLTAEEFARYDLVLLSTAHQRVLRPCSLPRDKAGGGYSERGERRVGPEGDESLVSPNLRLPATMEPSSPFVSVLMPVRNEAAYISRSLGAVLAQDYPRERVEVIVADGMSTDGTREIIEEIQASHPDVRLLDNPGLIAPTALNLATAAARGEILVRVDGHCEIAADYVSNCVRHLLEDGVDGVGGSVETIGENEAAEAIAVAMSSIFGVGGSAFRTAQGKTMLVDTIPFPAYTRQVVEKAGPYDETMVRDQDDEYNYRIRKLGGRLLLAADVRSRYYSRAGLSSLWRQYFQYGYWKARVLWKHPRQMSVRQFVPGLFVACLIGLALLAPVSRSARRFLWAMLLAYGAASAVASVEAASRTDWRHLPRLPVAFGALHLSYGSGFLLGNWRVLAQRARTSGHNEEAERA